MGCKYVNSRARHLFPAPGCGVVAGNWLFFHGEDKLNVLGVASYEAVVRVDDAVVGPILTSLG